MNPLYFQFITVLNLIKYLALITGDVEKAHKGIQAVDAKWLEFFLQMYYISEVK